MHNPKLEFLGCDMVAPTGTKGPLQQKTAAVVVGQGLLVLVGATNRD